MASEIIKNNQMLLRGCILYEYTSGKQLFDAYKNFCKVMGDDTMEYLDFEYWFVRFSRGEFDLNYDKSLDPKYSRSLSDVPVEIMAKIMENRNWKDVLSLRQVSQSFELIVDDIKFPFKNLCLGLRNSDASLSVDNVYDDYKTEITKSDEEDSDGVWLETVKKTYHDLRILMKIPKIYLEEFKVDFNMISKYQELYSTIESFTDPTGHVLKTRRICLEGCRVIDWLQCVEPGTLEEIEIKDGCAAFNSKTQILKTEQWKQAKTLIVKGWLMNCFPVKYFINFVRIDIQFYGPSVEYFLELKNALLKSPNFEKFSIQWLPLLIWDLEHFDAIERDIGINNRKEQIDPNHHHYVIQQDNKTFEIKIGPLQVAHLEDVIRNDKVAIKSCILYEFCKANPVEIPIKETKKSEETPAKTTGNSMFANFKPSPLVEIRPKYSVYSSYESLCKVIGYDTMDYREFDYWYYQFADGNFNLDCEKSFKNQISLMNMPIEIITKVTGKLDLKERKLVLVKFCGFLPG